MPEMKPGCRCQTARGAGTCTALTSMQVRVHLDEDDEGRWFPRGTVVAIEADAEPEAPTIQELLATIEVLVQEVRTRLALEQPQQTDATEETGR
jgi:hypothetical protein